MYHLGKKVIFVEFAKQLKRYRKKEKYSQDDVAEKLSVSRQMIRDWECGVCEPDEFVVGQLANIFHTSTEELLCGDEVEEQHHKMQRQINWLYVGGVLLTIGCSSLAVVKQQSSVAWVLPIIITFMIGIVVGVFGYAIRNDEYSMIAGYDDDVQYNKQVLRRMLIMVERSMIMVYIGTMMVCIAGVWYQQTPIVIGSMIMNIVSLFVCVLGSQVRYRNTLYQDKKQVNYVVQEIKIVVFYVMMILMMVGAVSYTFWSHDIHNNTTQALQVMGIVLPGFIGHTICLFCLNQKVKQETKISVLFWVIYVTISLIWLVILISYPY